MSSILGIAPLVGIVGAGLLWLLLRVLRTWYAPRWFSRLGCLLPLLTFPIVTVATLTILPANMTHSGIGVQPGEANRHLLLLEVPAAARDVNYRHAFFGARIDQADFRIHEDDFLAWLDQNEWTPHEFNDSDVLIQPFSSDELLELANGYRYDSYDADDLDSGFSIVYDKDTQRAYMWRSLH